MKRSEHSAVQSTLWVKSRHLRGKSHFRFTLKSGHSRCKRKWPLSANSGHSSSFNNLMGPKRVNSGHLTPVDIASALTICLGC